MENSFKEESDKVDEFLLNCRFGRDEDIKLAFDLLDQYPNNFELWRICGQLIEMSKTNTYQIDEARYCYERAIDLKPSFYRGYEDLGDWYCVRSGELQTAIEYYRKAIELGNKDSSRVELAYALASLGQSELALQELELCIDKCSEDYAQVKRQILEGLLDPPQD